MINTNDMNQMYWACIVVCIVVLCIKSVFARIVMQYIHNTNTIQTGMYLSSRGHPGSGLPPRLVCTVLDKVVPFFSSCSGHSHSGRLHKKL